MRHTRRWSALALTSLLLPACGPTPAPADTDTPATSTSAGPGPTSSENPQSTDSPTSTSTSTSTTSSASATSTTTTTTTTSGTTEEPCNFVCTGTEPQCQQVPGLDGELRCSQCSVWSQDCPRGHKCSAWANNGGTSWNSVKCVEVVEDPGKPGEPCKVEGSAASGIDTCERGAMCWDVDPDTLVGTCVALCGGPPESPTCADPEANCVIANQGVLNLCLPGCDPLLLDCPAGQVCVDADVSGFICAPGPKSDPPGGVGAPCEFLNACEPGLACIPGDLVPGCLETGCCSPYCAVSAPNTCPDAPTQICLPWYDPGEAPAGLEDLGVCGLP